MKGGWVAMARPRKPRPAVAATPTEFPLTEEHCELLCGVEESCAAAKAVIERCQRAGYDVGDYAAVVEQQRAMAEGLKREFFPGRI